MGLLNKIFNFQKKHLKKLRARAERIDALKDTMRAKSDEELRNKTLEFKEKIKAAGEKKMKIKYWMKF